MKIKVLIDRAQLAKIEEQECCSIGNALAICDSQIAKAECMTIKEVTKLLIANRHEEALKALELTDQYWAKRDKKDPIVCLLLAYIKAKLGKSSEDFIKDFAFGITRDEDYSEYLKMYDFGIPKD